MFAVPTDKIRQKFEQAIAEEENEDHQETLTELMNSIMRQQEYFIHPGELR